MSITKIPRERLLESQDENGVFGKLCLRSLRGAGIGHYSPTHDELDLITWNRNSFYPCLLLCVNPTSSLWMMERDAYETYC